MLVIQISDLIAYTFKIIWQVAIYKKIEIRFLNLMLKNQILLMLWNDLSSIQNCLSRPHQMWPEATWMT